MIPEELSQLVGRLLLFECMLMTIKYNDLDITVHYNDAIMSTMASQPLLNRLSLAVYY